MMLRNALGWLILLLSSIQIGMAQVGVIGSFHIEASSPSVARYDPLPKPFPGATLGKPFSGEEALEVRRRLPNGSIVATLLASRKLWRDSNGRLRVERALPVLGTTSTLPVVEITDPPGGFWYALDVQKLVAHRQALPAASHGTRSLSQKPITPGVEPMIELGRQVIANELADGMKSRFEIGKGSDGSAIYRENEVWMISDLNVIVRSIITDPLHGDVIKNLTGLKRVEPDANLFRVPTEYRIVDETGPFSISYSR